MASDLDLFSGGSKQAARWITNSSLPLPSKNNLLHFVQAYAELTFGRLSHATLDDFESNKNVSFSPWLRAFLNTLAVLGDGAPVRIQFDRFEREVPGLQGLASSWFQFGFALEPSSDFERIRLAGQTLLIVAQKAETPFSILAVKISDQSDDQVLHFVMEDILPGGEIEPADVQVVFSSLAALFDHVVAIRQMGDRKPKDFLRSVRSE